ncbi:DNA mismatch repair protein MutT [Streptomyces koyangensis]|uniref:DNA mismatch repair protein MutT n=1 Tax=Streptomyces koyangensis TaxID=188770 RepID=UPI003C2EAFA3
MTPPSPRLRVAAYVIGRGPPPALLVFDHAGMPEAGTQVPAGGIRAGELPEWAVGRETAEDRADGNRGPAPRGGGEAAPDTGLPRRTAFFLLQAPDEAQDAWLHRVGAEDGDAGFTFACRFVPLPLVRWTARRTTGGTSGWPRPTPAWAVPGPPSAPAAANRS